jgi:hypothetical protein
MRCFSYGITTLSAALAFGPGFARTCSVNDINWTLLTNPELSPSSNPVAWDSQRIETPSVIQIGSVYHMYYTGCDAAH